MDNPSAVNGSVGDQATISQEEFQKLLGDLARQWNSYRKKGLEIRHQTAEEFHQRVSELARQWNSYREEGLEIRHKTGKLLNDHFGSPDAVRQTYGEGTLKAAGKQLGLSESEISRMRWFAHRFVTLKDLEAASPKAKTWTAVKKLLPKLRPEGQAQKEEPSDGAAHTAKVVEATPPCLDVVKRALADLSSTLRQVQQDLTEEEKEDLFEQFKEVARVVGDCLKIHVSVGQVPAGETPPAGTE